MDLNLERLCKKLTTNTQEILKKIHSDPKLTKRYCPFTNLWIANAAKDLFTPEAEHQLFAKGIVYSSSEDGEFNLVSLSYIKMYNYGENQDVKTHVAEMISTGAEAVYLNKCDGTLVQRFVWRGRIVLATRGMIETMAETDEQKQYFKWAREIIAQKYPKIYDTNYLPTGTSLFELIGPGNQIVTHYPEWDLVWTGYCKIKSIYSNFYDILGSRVNEAFNFPLIEYMSYSELQKYNDEFSYCSPVTKLYTFGNTLEEQIQSINQLFSSTDDEGSVIQFEKKDQFGISRVVGRVKAKTDNYRQLLKIINGCTYDKIVDIIKTDLIKFNNWDNFESHLKSFGAEKFPEELMINYKQYFNDFWQHYARCCKFMKKIANDTAQILDKNKIKFSFGNYNEFVIDKKARAEFAKKAIDHPYNGCLFAELDGALTLERVCEKILKEPKDSEAALIKLGIV